MWTPSARTALCSLHRRFSADLTAVFQAQPDGRIRMPLTKLLKDLKIAGTTSPGDLTANGSFTGTLTGCTTSPTGTITYNKIGRMVYLSIPQIGATSNATSATITGMPGGITPLRAQVHIGIAKDNGTVVVAVITIGTNGVITLKNGITSANFTSSGAKGIEAQVIAYPLD